MNLAPVCCKIPSTQFAAAEIAPIFCEGIALRDVHGEMARLSVDIHTTEGNFAFHVAP
jgi:hypothetical protein